MNIIIILIYSKYVLLQVYFVVSLQHISIFHSINHIDEVITCTVTDEHIEILGRCNFCFRGKKSTKYCRIVKSHCGETAAPCSSCFEQSLSTSHCRYTLRHCGPGVFWMTEALDKKKIVPQCYSSLNSVVFTTHETNIPVDPTATIAHLGPQCPQDYANGFFIDYSAQKWDEWRRTFEHQTGVMLKLCTGINTNKEASTGVLKMGAHAVQYTVGWRLQYTCFRGGQPRYKESEQTKKPRNAPGSRLSGCTATLNARLLKLECGELLHITFPLPSAHSGHSLKSLADLQSYKPLPEVIGRVESLVSNSYLSQVSLKLSLKEWVTKELIPQHIKQGILDDRPSEYDRHYYPTIQDLRNITKSVINKIRKNMFDQDALEALLQDEMQQHHGFRYSL